MTKRIYAKAHWPAAALRPQSSIRREYSIEGRSLSCMCCIFATRDFHKNSMFALGVQRERASVHVYLKCASQAKISKIIFNGKRGGALLRFDISCRETLGALCAPRESVCVFERDAWLGCCALCLCSCCYSRRYTVLN